MGILFKSKFDFKDIWCVEEKDINARKYSTVHIRFQAIVRKLISKQENNNSVRWNQEIFQ